MAATDREATAGSSSTNAKRTSSGLTRRILIALGCGIAVGLLFGERVAFLSLLGNAYIGLLQMTVLPYIVVALISSVGHLSPRLGRRLFASGGLTLLVLWGVTLLGVAFFGVGLPELAQGSFFSVSAVEAPPETDFLSLFIPFNVFSSLASDVVPAVVVFCLLLGGAVMGLPGKERLLDVLDVARDGLLKVNGYVVRLTPIGVFGMMASAAGTLTIEEFGRIQGYLLSYTLLVFLLAFWVLPALIAAVTPFSIRDVSRATRPALLTAFATGKVMVVLPMLIDAAKDLFARDGSEREAGRHLEAVFPLAYAFPHAGKLVALLFIPFAAWFLGRPLGLELYPLVLGAGLVSYFGGPVIATPFLLDLVGLPQDMMQLFLVSGIYTSRLGDVLGAMHLMAMGLITTASLTGCLRVRWRTVGRTALIATGLAALGLLGTRLLLEKTFRGAYQREDVLTALNSIAGPADFTVLSADAPPLPLPPDGESRLSAIRARGTLRAAFDADGRPFTFRNPRGDLVGLDVEMAMDLAASLGAGLELLPVPVAEVPRALEAGRVDVALGGLVANLERAATVEISDEYLQVHAALACRESARKALEERIVDWDFQGLRIAVSDATFLPGVRRVLGAADVVPIERSEDYFAATTAPADALVTSAEAAAAWTLAHPEYAVVPLGRPAPAFPVVFGLPRGDRPLRQLVNHWIMLRRRDGTIDRLFAHWVLGQQQGRRAPRWSVLRDVLGWID